MESNVIRLPAADASNLLAQARPFEPDPPSSQGTCDRCGYRGAVYAGRYGGQRCAVCFGPDRLDATGRALSNPRDPNGQ
jgi:hypothetical protein